MKVLLLFATLGCARLAAANPLEDSSDSDDIGKIIDAIEDELMRGTFKARAEITSFNETSFNEAGAVETNTIVEYHDAVSGLHSLQILPQKGQQFYYPNLADPIFVSVDNDGKCTKRTEEEAVGHDGFYLYKSADPLAPSKYLLGPSAEIALIKKEIYTATKSNSSKVRGLPAIRYTFEKLIDNPDIPNISVWFADRSWSLVSSKGNVPFPIRIEHKYTDRSQRIDFFEVENVSQQELVRLGENLMLPFLKDGDCSLSLPVGVVDPPALANMIYFTAETEDGASATEYFSIEEGLYRADQDDGKSIILEDKLALKYELHENCDAKPNEINGDAVMSAPIARGSNNPGALAVRAYQTLQNKYYIGEAAVRGMPTIIWESTTPKGEFQAGRFFFEHPNVISPNAGNNPETLVLAKAVIVLKGNDKPIEVSISDYHASDSSNDFNDIFNIEDCVHQSQYFDFVYEADRSLNKELFEAGDGLIKMEDYTKEAIIETLGISPMQVSYMKAEIMDDTKYVQVYVKLLQSPKYIASFTDRPKLMGHPKAKFIDSHTAEGCAQDCVEKGKSCATFLFCSGLNCYPMEDSNSTTWEIEPGTEEDCKVYDKSPNVTDVKRPTLDAMSSILDTAVTNREEQFTFTIVLSCDENHKNCDKVKLTSYRLHAHLSQFNDGDSMGPYKQVFNSKSLQADDDASLKIGEEIRTKGDCYRECLQSTKIACASFSICTNSKVCVLSSVNIHKDNADDDQKRVVKQDAIDCTVYTMNYLAEFDKIPSKVLKAGSKNQITANSAGDCAVKCRQELLHDGSKCHSFDFCTRKNLCSLYHFHYNWNGGDDALQDDEGCDHYALRYSASFTASGKMTLGDHEHIRLVEAVSMEECAKQCSEMSNNDCKTLSYCDSDKGTKCFLYPITKDKSKGTHVDSSCTFYTKDSSLANEVIKPDRQTPDDEGLTIVGMGNGAFAFLLIVMLAIGVGIGVASFMKRDRILAIAGRGGARSESGVHTTTISYNRQNDENSATIEA